MFGVKLRTWMESHIVRPRKKQGLGGKIATGKGGKVAPERSLLDSAGNSPTSPATDAKHHRLHHTHQGVLRCEINYTGSGGTDHSMGTSSGANGSVSAGMAAKPVDTIRLPAGSAPSIGNNLSSPESAYSTGYSTDGTSPGASFPPPEYYVNIRTGTHYFHSTTPAGNNGIGNGLAPSSTAECANLQRPEATRGRTKALPNGRATGLLEKDHLDTRPLPRHAALAKAESSNSTHHRRTESCDGFNPSPSTASSAAVHVIGSPVATSTSTASPRQRTRIRTNPWVANANGVRPNATSATESSSSCSDGTLPRKLLAPTTNGARGMEDSRIPEEMPISSSKPRSPYNTRFQHRVSSPKKSLKNNGSRQSNHEPLRYTPARFSSSSSSSSCSSSRRSTLDELSDDDLTLNEMLGKYDESYVYEKETDILSDSDPTDCEDEDVGGHTQDEETGDDVGDEEELDFIDNGSLVEYQPPSDTLTNRGHCSYYLPPNAGANGMRRSRKSSSMARHSKRGSSRRAGNQRSKPTAVVSTVIANGEHREGVSLSKILRERIVGLCPVLGSRSAGNTPVGGRKLGHETPQDRTLTKRRAMSISVASRLDINLAVLQADKEADLKYRQLILEAEHLLSSMTSPCIPPPPPPPISLPLKLSTDSQPQVKSPSTPRPSLVTYKSIEADPVGNGAYCPQSEPVKRKVYKCSPSFDKLQKSFEKSHQTSSLKRNEQNENEEPRSDRASLKEKLEQLRRQRQAAEAQNLDDQRRISVARRQMLVHTIEGLKRSLEDQSAKLQETYRADQEAVTKSPSHSGSPTEPSSCTSPKQRPNSPQQRRDSPKPVRNSPKPVRAICEK